MALDKTLSLPKTNIPLAYWRVTTVAISAGSPSKPQPHALIQIEGLVDADAEESIRESRQTIFVTGERFTHYFAPAALDPLGCNPIGQAYEFLKSSEADDRKQQELDLSGALDA